MPSEEQLQAFRQLPLDGRATEIARLFTLVSNSVEMFKKIANLKHSKCSKFLKYGRSGEIAGLFKLVLRSGLCITEIPIIAFCHRTFL